MKTALPNGAFFHEKYFDKGTADVKPTNYLNPKIASAICTDDLVMERFVLKKMRDDLVKMSPPR